MFKILRSSRIRFSILRVGSGSGSIHFSTREPCFHLWRADLNTVRFSVCKNPSIYNSAISSYVGRGKGGGEACNKMVLSPLLDLPPAARHSPPTTIEWKCSKRTSLHNTRHCRQWTTGTSSKNYETNIGPTDNLFIVRILLNSLE